MNVSAHVHRFHGKAAIAFTGVPGPTLYLTPEDAAALAQALQECADDIRTLPNFAESQFSPAEIALSNNGSRFNG